MKDGEPFAIAGLWEEWEGQDGEVIESCTLLTTEPNDRLLGCARGGGRTGTPRRLPYNLGVSDTPAHSSDALFRSQSEVAAVASG